MPIFEPTIILKPERVYIAESARVDSFCKIEGGEGVNIAEYVHIASFCHLNIGGGELAIGNYAACASGVKIVTGSNKIDALSCSAIAPANMQRIEKSVVGIGDYAVIFAGAIILPGVIVGEGAVVAAGAVVRENVDPWTIVAGVPARPIGKREVKR